MKLNRRNTLIGLGTIVAGGGAALGTGAFSTVEADRTVDFGTTGDADALLAFEVNSDTLEGEDGNDGQIEIDVQDLNEDAKTRFDEAITVENNGENDVELSIEDVPDDMRINYDETDLSDGEATVSIDADDDLDLDVIFDIDGDAPTEDSEVTFVAEAEDDSGD
ncbi:hypothetical protein [Natronococcus sp. A-GB7]|uniref:hypothetical protein n=1 Tax=Natronococcus sp. A-GB7 TaxID=3037649 RepID=UPI0024203D53|nr:hypothetical protein [Natronococcus sp. A-GB7]MDG5820130.1 hypothetical protein [Natronococcus sp. A-GB7]